MRQGSRGSLRSLLGRLVAAVGLAGAGLVALAIAGMLLASSDYRNAGLRALDRQEAANQILVDLLNAETGNRGYILTGRGDYLTPYTEARDRYDEDIATLRRLVEDEPRLVFDVETVDRTAQLWFEEAVELIRLRRQLLADDAVARVNEGIGAERIEEFRVAHASLLSDVSDIREEALASADRTRLWTLSAVSAAALLALGVVIVAVIQVWRRMGAPVALVAEGVARVARGRFTEPVPARENAAAELKELTTGFNEMQAQLSAQRTAVAAAARREAAQDAERNLWGTLQAGLLPQDLPRLPGLRVVARYEPAERGLLLGGDFYDAILLDDGRLAVAVGDLAGHGAPVAARAAGLRFGWRTLVEVDSDPATVMGGLNRQLSGPQERSAGVFASLVYLLISPDGTFRLSCAGHPAPLLLANGACAPVDFETGPVLGVMDLPEWPVTDLVLPPGGTLFLFTDGLFEARRGLDFFGEERVAQVVAQESASAVEARVERVIAAARRHDEFGLRDDVVVMAIERAATPPSPRDGAAASEALEPRAEPSSLATE